MQNIPRKKQKVDTIKSLQEVVFFFLLINQKYRAREFFFFNCLSTGKDAILISTKYLVSF
jgi:hypothetical protein